MEFRFHRTILYNSIYRADDQVLVNTHLFGVTAAHAPVWHLRKLPGRGAGRAVHRQLRAGLGNGHAFGWGLAGVARRIDFYDDPAAPAGEQPGAVGQRGGDQFGG